MRNGYKNDPEYQKLMDKALATSIISDQRQIVIDGVTKELSKDHPPLWAACVKAEFFARGAERLVKMEKRSRAPKFAVAKGSGKRRKELGLAHAVGGVIRRSRNNGARAERQQVLFELMTWDELRAKLPEYAIGIKAYERNRALVEKLLTLETRAPGTANPREACEALEIDVHEFTAGVA